MDERRKETRRKLMAFTPVYDLHPRSILGYLGDLTLRGALVIGEKLITINKETMLEIDFPSAETGGNGENKEKTGGGRTHEDRSGQYPELTGIRPGAGYCKLPIQTATVVTYSRS